MDEQHSAAASARNQRSLLAFLAGRFLGLLGDQLLLFAVPLLVYQTTGSVRKSGLMFFVEWTPRILSLPIAGVLSDHSGGRKIYLRSDLARALACFAAFGALRWGAFSSFAVLAFLVGINAFFYSQAFLALEATVPKLVPLEDLPKAQAKLQLCDQVSQIAGPVLATVLGQLLGKEALIGIVGIAFTISFINVAILRDIEAPRAQRERRSLVGDLALGAQVLGQYRSLFTVIGLTWLANLMIGTTLATSAAVITGVFAKSDRHFGSLITLAGCVAVAGFLILPILLKRFSMTRIGFVAFCCMAGGGLVAGYAPGFYGFAAGVGTLLGSVGIFNVFLRTERARIIPREHLGKTIGLIVLLNNCALPLSGLLVGAGFTDRIGPQGMIRIITLATLLPASILLGHLFRRSSPEYAVHS